MAREGLSKVEAWQCAQAHESSDSIDAGLGRDGHLSTGVDRRFNRQEALLSYLVRDEVVPR
jgi:hypothetical protein